MTVIAEIQVARVPSRVARRMAVPAVTVHRRSAPPSSTVSKTLPPTCSRWPGWEYVARSACGVATRVSPSRVSVCGMLSALAHCPSVLTTPRTQKISDGAPSLSRKKDGA